MQDKKHDSQHREYTVLDAETTTHNKGHPFDPRNKLISYAILRSDPSPCRFFYYTDPDFERGCKDLTGTLVGFNFKFDCHWLYPQGVVNPVWDCQLAEFVYTGQRDAFASLNECLEKYGLETKIDIVKGMWEAGIGTEDIPLPVLEEYNKWDVEQTEKLFLVQQQLLSEEQKRLVYAMGEDLKVLAHMERAGILFDSDKAKEKLAAITTDVAAMEEELKTFLPEIKYGKFNFDSGDHLSALLYGATIEFDYFISEPATYKSGSKKGQEYTKNSWFQETVVFPQRFKPLERSEVKKTKGKTGGNHFYQTDEPTLKQLSARSKENKRLVEILLLRAGIKKVAEMLQGIFDKFEERGWENNLIHAAYNQNVARTGRLSSSGPNLQNTPPEIDEFLISRYD